MKYGWSIDGHQYHYDGVPPNTYIGAQLTATHAHLALTDYVNATDFSNNMFSDNNLKNNLKNDAFSPSYMSGKILFTSYPYF